jgi:hypothetical protein
MTPTREEVERLALRYGRIEPNKIGNYVRYGTYNALAAENAALRERLDAAETRGWNAAIEAAADTARTHLLGLPMYLTDPVVSMIRALRRNTETSND